LEVGGEDLLLDRFAHTCRAEHDADLKLG